MANAMDIKDQENFATRTERLRKGLADGATGPLRMAKEVLAVTAEWDTYKDEANVTAAQWIRSLRHGVDMRFFALRAVAAERIGADARRWDHEAAIWAVGQPQAQNDLALRTLVKRVAEERAKAGPVGPPLCKNAVRRIALEVWGAPAKKPKVIECSDCGEKAAEIAALKAQLAAVTS